MSKEKVYWSPIYDPSVTNWNILYKKPSNVLSRYQNKKEKDSERDFYYCPVVSKTMMNVYEFYNPIYTKIILDDSGSIDYKNSKMGIESWISDGRTLKDSPFLFYNLPMIFFAESEIEMMITSPFFGSTPYLSYASLVPGKFNIGSWFRTINFEFNMWSNKFEIKEDEPIAFINFLTDKNVELNRFNLTQNLFNMANVNSTSAKWLPNYPIQKRYDLFRKSNIREIILKEIKENLI